MAGDEKIDPSDLTNLTLAINSPEGDHFGFILMSLHPGGDSGEGYEGDCVFMVLPFKPELMHAPLADILWLYHFKASGEHSVKLSRRGQRIKADIIPLIENRLIVDFEQGGTGHMWRLPDEITPIAEIVMTAKGTDSAK